jgi:hypothetical protein
MRGEYYEHVLHIYPHEAEWTQFQTHCYSENVVALEIEPGISGATIIDHRVGPLKVLGLSK